MFGRRPRHTAQFGGDVLDARCPRDFEIAQVSGDAQRLPLPAGEIRGHRVAVPIVLTHPTDGRLDPVLECSPEIRRFADLIAPIGSLDYTMDEADR